MSLFYCKFYRHCSVSGSATYTLTLQWTISTISSFMLLIVIVISLPSFGRCVVRSVLSMRDCLLARVWSVGEYTLESSWIIRQSKWEEFHDEQLQREYWRCDWILWGFRESDVEMRHKLGWLFTGSRVSFTASLCDMSVGDIVELGCQCLSLRLLPARSGGSHRVSTVALARIQSGNLPRVNLLCSCY